MEGKAQGVRLIIMPVMKLQHMIHWLPMHAEWHSKRDNNGPIGFTKRIPIMKHFSSLFSV